MSETLSIIDLLETARQKLGGISACLNDSKKFAHAVTDFDSWLDTHSQQLSSASDLNQNTREQVADILRQLTRLELQARHNANLVGDMQSYLREGDPADDYPAESCSMRPRKILDAITRDETAAVTAAEDGAPELSEVALPELYYLNPALSAPALRTPAAQIYAKQNQAIHQASQE